MKKYHLAFIIGLCTLLTNIIAIQKGIRQIITKLFINQFNNNRKLSIEMHKNFLDTFKR